MSRGYPSMTALLGLLAIAGYQNRDKIAEWVNAAQRKASGPTQVPEGGATSSLPGKLGGLLAGTGLGDMLGNGLRDLVDSFKQAGHGEVANSWVGHGPNKQIEVFPFRTHNWFRCFRYSCSANRLVARRDPFEAFDKSARSSGQIYAGWANPNGYRLFKILSESRVGLGRVNYSEVIGLVAQ